MAGMKRELFAFLKQVLWALFLVYLVLLVFAYLFGKQIGFELSFSVSLGIALLVTLTFVSIYFCNVIWIAVDEYIKRRRMRK